MSGTPTSAKDPTIATVTPIGVRLTEANDTVAELTSDFESETLSRIVDLLVPGSEVLWNGIDKLFATHWQATSWSDLMVFSSSDVVEALRPSADVPSELSAPVIVKKLGYIVDYARIGTLDPTVTMSQIVTRVTTPSADKGFPTSPTSPSRRLVQVFDKKAVPTIDKFSGHDEDFFAWRESTINTLGTAGFGRFLDDTQVATKHPEVAESVFYALRGAVHGGQAQSIAQAMLDDKKLDPCELWASLEGYYNTALNRANVVLFDIRRLLNIRLDPGTTATKFISDFRDCLQRLRKNNARLSDDSDTLRALLLVAIQDDDFEMVRDSIVHRPNESVETILTEIRERETSLMMKDRASNLNNDGTPRYSRRTQQSSSSSTRTNSKEPSPSDAIKPGNRKWCIPKYPDTWRKSFGHSLFKLALDWRTDAHKGRTQEELNKNFDTVIESYVPGQKSSKKSKSRLNTSSPESSGTTAASTTGSELQAEGGESEPPRKRIRLQKSRRVVTERSA